MDTIVMVKPGKISTYEVIPLKDYRILMLYLPPDRTDHWIFGKMIGKFLWERRTKAFWYKSVMPLFSPWDRVYLWTKYVPEQMQGLLHIPLFDDYMEEEWVLRLLEYGVPGPFFLLGKPKNWEELFRVILEKANRKMKNLFWLSEENPEYAPLAAIAREEFLDFCEEEYGLIPQCEIYRQTTFREPVTILDFTKKTALPCLNVPKGSVWIDFASMEGKAARLEMRKQGILYFSQRREWEKIYVK